MILILQWFSIRYKKMVFPTHKSIDNFKNSSIIQYFWQISNEPKFISKILVEFPTKKTVDNFWQINPSAISHEFIHRMNMLMDELELMSIIRVRSCYDEEKCMDKTFIFYYVWLAMHVILTILFSKYRLMPEFLYHFF